MIDATGMPQSALVVGASSDIARETVRLLAGRRLERVVLAGRDTAALEAFAKELHALGLTASVLQLDVTEVERLDDLGLAAGQELGEIDLVLVAPGDLGTAVLEDLDASKVASLLAVNFSGPAATMLVLGKMLRRQGHGRIVVLSSVAGVRVRKANFVYGSAKAGLDGFALGLADALYGSGVQVSVVRPGFVRTKMTAGLEPQPLAVDAPVVAAAIVRGLETGASVIWVPASLRLVFAVLRVFPRALWRRMPG